MIERLRDAGTPWTGQIELVRDRSLNASTIMRRRASIFICCSRCASTLHTSTAMAAAT